MFTFLSFEIVSVGSFVPPFAWKLEIMAKRNIKCTILYATALLSFVLESVATSLKTLRSVPSTDACAPECYRVKIKRVLMRVWKEEKKMRNHSLPLFSIDLYQCIHIYTYYIQRNRVMNGFLLDFLPIYHFSVPNGLRPYFYFYFCLLKCSRLNKNHVPRYLKIKN